MQKRGWFKTIPLVLVYSQLIQRIDPVPAGRYFRIKSAVEKPKVPEYLMAEAEGDDLDLYEVPVPVLYILEKGYRVYKNHIICDAPYDPIFGLDVDNKWIEI